MFWLIIPFAFLISSIQCLKNKHHDKLSAVSLMVFCIIWIMSKGCSLLVQHFTPLHIGVNKLFLTLFIILNGISLIIACVALKKYNASVYKTGRSQAGCVLLFSFIFGLVQFVAFNKITPATATKITTPTVANTKAVTETKPPIATKTKPDFKEVVDSKKSKPLNLEFKDKNYILALPQNDNYQLADYPHLINSEADFILTESDKKSFMMVIAEKSGVNSKITMEALLEAIKLNLKLASSSANIISSNKQVVVDGVPAREICATALINKVSFRYNIRLFVHNGITYQLMTYSPSSFSEEYVSKQAQYLSSHFKIIDRNKRHYSSDITLLTKFISQTAPYELNFRTDTSWIEWDNTEESLDSEFIGQTVDTDNHFRINSLHINTSLYTDAELATGMLRDFNFSLGDDKLKVVKKFNDKPFKPYEISAARTIDEKDYNYHFQIYYTPNSVFSIAVWGSSGKEKIQSLNKELLEELKLKKEQKKFHVDAASEQMKKNQADLLNGLGNVLFDVKKYKQASDVFFRAYKLNPELEVAVTNCFTSLSKIQDFKTIVDFIKLNPKLLLNPDILAWNAFSLNEVNLLKPALENYAKLFREFKEYDNDNDFLDYTKLLIAQKKSEDLRQLSASYLVQEKPQKTFHSFISALINGKLLKLAKEKIDTLPESYKKSIETKRLTIRYYIASGDFKKAVAVFTALLKDGHRDKTTLYAGAKLYYDIGWYGKAKDTLQELLNILPNDKRANELMNSTLSYLGEGEKGNTVNKITPVPIPQKIQAKINLIKSPKITDDLQYTYFLTCYNYDKKRLKKTIYRKLILNTPKGVKDNSTIYYTYTPTSSHVYVNNIKVTSPDGLTVTLSDRSAFYISDADDDQANEDKILCMPISSLTPGCTVEYSITEKFYANYKYFPFKRYWLTLTVPFDFIGVTISGDIDSIASEMHNSDSKVVKDGNQLFFQPAKSVVYKSEPKKETTENIYPILILGDKKLQWKNEVQEYLNDIKTKLVPGPVLDKLVQELIQNKKTKKEKVKALISYIQNNITYKAIEFGKRGIIPDNPQKVLKQKYGDCKDLSVLLQQMLKVIDIKSTLVLADSSYKVYENIPSLDQFDHMILYIDDLDCFVDGTVKYADLLTISSAYLSGRRCLLLNANEPELKHIPYYKSAKTSIEVESHISFKGKDLLAIKETIKLSDYHAYFLRSSIHSYSEKGLKDFLENFVSYWPETINFTYELVNLNNYNKDLIIKMQYDVKNAIKIINGERSVHIEDSWFRYYFSPVESLKRFSPLKVFYDSSISHKSVYHLPDNSNTVIDIKNNEVKEKYLTAKHTMLKKGNTIITQLNCQINKGLYKATDYEVYYQKIRTIIDKSSFLFKLK